MEYNNKCPWCVKHLSHGEAEHSASLRATPTPMTNRRFKKLLSDSKALFVMEDFNRRHNELCSADLQSRYRIYFQELLTKLPPIYFQLTAIRCAIMNRWPELKPYEVQIIAYSYVVIYGRKIQYPVFYVPCVVSHPVHNCLMYYDDVQRKFVFVCYECEKEGSCAPVMKQSKNFLKGVR